MWRSFQDRRREQQALQLLDRARREQRAGRLPAALRSQLDALGLIRALAEAHPDDPRHRQATASALYTLASIQIQAERFTAAVDTLTESEALYAALGRAGVLDAAPFVADVRVRRAVALMRQGHGASAVPEMDTAVTTYAELNEADETAALRRDVSRVLAVNAIVLARFGDPDLACASADTALRTYLSHVISPGSFTVHGEDAGYLRNAAAVAAAVHVRHGRPAIGLVAANFALQLAGEGGVAALAHLRELTDNVERLTAVELDALDQEFSSSLALVTHFEPAPGSDLDRLQRTTLADALAAVRHDGVAADLAGALTRPAADGEIVFPAQRCHPQLAPLRARQLGALAVDVLPTAPIPGLRMALEAHYLFASADRARAAAMRHQLPDLGPVWAATLLAASAEFEARHDLPMALDLASWAARVAQRLTPFTDMDTALASLVRECVRRHGRLLIDSGDRAAGEAALSAAGGLTVD